MISNKIKWSAGLLLVIVLIVFTNFIDQKNFQRIQDSVDSIYKDRLIAKDLLFDIQLEIHDKELLLAENKDAILLSNRSASEKKIQNFLQSFSNTALTRDEEQIFEHLKEEIRALFSMEMAYLPSENSQPSSAQLKGQAKKINAIVAQLSDIQIAEGQRQMQLGRKAMESIDLLTQLEIWVMIILGVLIQFVILYSPKKELTE
ncbi:MCP four helix bundle domain-containing protein [Nonlabens sp.]|uniref:MCP four helix bundle domain-containing protein n=1 Tax=Nonlabens sp. TaxID=1888209 RepID=UPI001BCAB359|nr:MCP four helix bundle domain-containing protein [Nonlabens sp.]